VPFHTKNKIRSASASSALSLKPYKYTAKLNSEKIKPVAIAIIRSHFSECISYSEFYINSVEGFMVDLKTLLSLAMRN